MQDFIKGLLLLTLWIFIFIEAGLFFVTLITGNAWAWYYLEWLVLLSIPVVILREVAR